MLLSSSLFNRGVSRATPPADLQFYQSIKQYPSIPLGRHLTVDNTKVHSEHHHRRAQLHNHLHSHEQEQKYNMKNC
jgi:hypothetical protein